MENPLDELKQKQRKLIYHFGEKVFDCYRTDGMDFVFPGLNTAQEKEISKLLTLLDYMCERVRKFEGIASREETSGTIAEPVPGSPSEVAEAPSENPAPAVSVEGDTVGEEMAETVPETANNETDELRWEESGSPAEVISLSSQGAAQTGQPSGTSNEESLTTTLTEGCEEVASVAAEAAALPLPDATPGRGAVPATFQGLRDSVRFKSETEQRLFEENLGILQNGDEKERLRALRNISYLGGKGALKEVCRLGMQDPGPAVRIAALKIASRTRDAENAGLYRAGLTDQDAGVRIASIKGLSMLLLKDCVPAIEPVLRDPDARVRGMTVTYLGIYGGPSGVQIASESWKDPDAYVRKSLVDVLAIVRAPGTLSVIRQLLEDPDEGVRRSAATALNKAKAMETKG